MQCTIIYTIQCIVRKSLEWQQTRGMYNTEVYSLIIGTYLVHSYNMNYVFNRWRPILGVVTSCALEKQISSLNKFFFKFCTWCIYNFSKLWIKKPSCTNTNPIRRTYYKYNINYHVTSPKFSIQLLYKKYFSSCHYGLCFVSIQWKYSRCIHNIWVKKFLEAKFFINSAISIRLYISTLQTKKGC